MKLLHALVSAALLLVALPAQAVTTVLSGVLVPEGAESPGRSGAGIFQLELEGPTLKFFVSSEFVDAAAPTSEAILGLNLTTGRMNLAFSDHGRGQGHGCSCFSIYTPFSYMKPTSIYELPLLGFPQYDCDIIFDISLFRGSIELTPEQQGAFLQAGFTLDYHVNPALVMNSALHGWTDPTIFVPVPEPSSAIWMALGACFMPRRR